MTIAVDPATNALVLVGSERATERVAELIRLLEGQIPPEPGRVRIVNLPQGVDANQVAGLVNATIRQIGSAGAENPGGFTGRVAVIADPVGGSLVVSANDTDFEALRSVVAALSRPGERAELTVKVYPLQTTNGWGAATAINDFLSVDPRGRQAQRLRAGQPVTITVTGPDGEQRQVELEAGSVRATPGPDGSSVLVTGPAAAMEVIDRFVALIDQSDSSSGVVIREYALEAAGAASVAQTLQRTFDASRDARRASWTAPQARFVGDERTNTLLVTATMEQHAEVERLLERLDVKRDATAAQVRVITLEHATVDQMLAVTEDLGWSLWDAARNAARAAGLAAPDEFVSVQGDARAGTLIVTGKGESFETMLSVIEELDQPREAGLAQGVRLIPVVNADLGVMRTVLEQALGDPNAARRWWEPPSPSALRVEVDLRSKSLIVFGSEEDLEAAETLVRRLDEEQAGEGLVVETIAVSHVPADRAASSVSQFFRDRARLQGQREAPVSVIGSRESGTLIVTGPASEMETARRLIADLDRADMAGQRSVEIVALSHADPEEIAGTVVRVFSTRGLTPERQVQVTGESRTKSLVVAAPADVMPDVLDLIGRLDTPGQMDSVELKTFSLEGGRAEDVARTLRETLGLDERGNPRRGDGGARFTDPESGESFAVRATIAADRRSNTVLVTADVRSMEVIAGLVAELDAQPEVSPVEYRVFELTHATARDVSSQINTLLFQRTWGQGEPRPNLSTSTEENAIVVSATPAQMGEIAGLIERLDVPPKEERLREFVSLRFAGADQVKRAMDNFYGRFATDPQSPRARNVSIVADPATESLVIMAPESEWAGIRELLAKLDAPEYDATKQLEVIALQHADARSVATALQQAFDAPLRAQLERDRARQEAERQRQRQFGGSDPFFSMMGSGSLVDEDELVTISAEPLTNTLIVSAGRKELEKIRSIVERLDVADFAKLPAPRIIPVRNGQASALAASIGRLYQVEGGRGGAGQSLRSVAIIGDDASGTLIVRAEDGEFAQIAALAEAMQQEGSAGEPGVRVLRLERQPAARVAGALQRTFSQTAAARNERFAIEVDRSTNSLVIACSEALFEQVRRVAEELDGGRGGAMDAAGGDGAGAGAAAGGGDGDDDGVQALLAGGLPGQGLYIFDLTHVSPAEMVAQLESLGVTRPAAGDRPGLVGEPVTLTALRSRQSMAALVGELDAPTLRSLVRALDVPPVGDEQEVALVRLRVASASEVSAAVRSLLDAGGNTAPTGLADSLAEQVRRLRLRGEGLDEPDIVVDLTEPVRIEPEPQTNSVLIASTRGNVRAIRELVTMLDSLPAGDAVTLRIFHLENAAASRLAGVVRGLFAQGDGLRRAPGSDVSGWPTTETGKALSGSVAITVDERTNALIVAGREESVALAEVLIARLDSSEGLGNWIEPRIIPLAHADAARVAQTLERVLVDGLDGTPEAEALRRQVGRLRMLRANPEALRGIVGDGANGNGAEVAGGEASGAGGDSVRAIESRLFAPMSTLTIVPEEDLNALLVVGSSENLAIVGELAALLDVPGAARSGAVRVYPLEHAAADRVSTVLERLFREQVARDTLREEDDLTIAADVRTNALIIATSPRSFTIVEQLLGTLDTPDARSTVGLHVIPVVGNDAQQLAPKVERLMRDRLQALRQGGASGREDVVSIQADAARNALIVAASAENLALIREVVDLLSSDATALDGDPSNPAGATVELFPLRSARAVEMVELLEELYVREVNRTRGQGTIRVRADERLNAVVVTGPRSDIAAIRDLVTRLDSTATASVSEIKIIPLSSANAIEMVTILQQILAGQSIAGGRDNRQGSLLRFIRQSAAGRIEGESGRTPSDTEITSAIREQVRLTPDVRTNSIVVSAPSEMMVLIETIIEELESSASGSRDIEIFTLENSDAVNMAELLRDLFNLRQQGRLYVLVPQGSMGASGGTAAGEGEETSGLNVGGSTLTLVPDERQQLAITVDARTNSLLVSATPQYLELVRSVVERLDTQKGTERVQMTFELRNARVEEVATALQTFIDREQSRLEATLGPDRGGSLLRQLEREISVVGVPGSSRLILSASPRYIDTLSELIRELDTPPAQVQIQVLLAEVTLDSEETWGLDFTLQPQGSNQLTATTRAAGSGVVTALGVPNLSVSTLDFDLLIRSLEVQGRLEVLSQPQILVNDNEEASINVGEEIQVVTAVTQLNDGQTRSNVESRRLGVIVNVTPSISPDGFVRMDITPEISALTARTTQISEDFEAPVISQRQADTTVTVRDGQTIIIGGLIQSEYETRRTKVPILGDIPFLGAPFRSSLTSRRKTELLIILQPRVIASDRSNTAVVDQMTRNQIERMSLPDEIRDALVAPDERGRWGLMNPGVSDSIGLDEKEWQREQEEREQERLLRERERAAQELERAERRLREREARQTGGGGDGSDAGGGGGGGGAPAPPGAPDPGAGAGLQ
ncbi:MAG: secretin N-terminal domain-containing protein [Phycisphaerales bacterium]